MEDWLLKRRREAARQLLGFDAEDEQRYPLLKQMLDEYEELLVQLGVLSGEDVSSSIKSTSITHISTPTG